MIKHLLPLILALTIPLAAAPKKKVSSVETMIFDAQSKELEGYLRDRSNPDQIDYNGNLDDIRVVLAEIHGLKFAERALRKRGFTGDSARLRPAAASASPSPVSPNANAAAASSPVPSVAHAIQLSSAEADKKSGLATSPASTPSPIDPATTPAPASTASAAPAVAAPVAPADTKPADASTKAKGSCGQCNKPDQTMTCARCKQAFYCNATCQKAHWKTHKPNCVPSTSVQREGDQKSISAQAKQPDFFDRYIEAYNKAQQCRGKIPEYCWGAKTRFDYEITLNEILREACFLGYVDVIENCIAQGLDVNSYGCIINRSRSILEVAITGRASPDMIILLLEKGAKPSEENMDVLKWLTSIFPVYLGAYNRARENMPADQRPPFLSEAPPKPTPIGRKEMLIRFATGR